MRYQTTCPYPTDCGEDFTVKRALAHEGNVIICGASCRRLCVVVDVDDDNHKLTLSAPR